MFPRVSICFLLCSLLLPPSAQAHTPIIRPGAVLVRFHSHPQTRSILPAGVSIDRAISPDSFSVRVPLGTEQAYADRLAALPDVVYAQVDHAVTAQVQPDDPRYSEQWNMARVGMPEAWNTITDTSALTIALLDTGVDVEHPDLQNQLWTNPNEIAGNGIDDDNNGFVDDVHGWHFYQVYSNGQALPRENGDVSDANGHGTHVSGIIAAVGNNGQGVAGVTWRAQMMMIRVLDDDAVGWESDIVRGLDYAVNNGARVVNMSLGLATPGPALAEAIARAEARGVVLVAAAGNTGGTALYPAAYSTVLSVGASTPDDVRASFSAHGARLDLLAPGVDILSTWNKLPYFTRSGTSMASPHVVGVAALLRVLHPQDTPAQIRACLIRTATDIGAPGRDDDTGWGLLNAARAVQGCPHLMLLPAVAR